MQVKTFFSKVKRVQEMIELVMCRKVLRKHFGLVEISFVQGATEYIEYFINGASTA